MREAVTIIRSLGRRAQAEEPERGGPRLARAPSELYAKTLLANALYKVFCQYAFSISLRECLKKAA